MKKKKLALIACAALAAVSLSACGGGQSGASDPNAPTTLRVAWWGGQPRHDATIKVIEMYKKDNPNVTIETEYSAWGDYWDKLNAQMSAKNLPDVIQQDYARLDKYIKSSQVVDLKPYVDSGKLDLTNVDKNYIGGQVGDKIYGLSLGTNALALMYNPAAFTKAGLKEPTPDYTWTNFMQDSKKMKEAGYPTELLLRNDPKFLLEQRLREMGKTLYNAEGTALGFDDAKILEELMQIQSDLVKDGTSIDKDISYPVQNVDEGLLANGKVWGEILWSNNVVPAAKVAEGHDIKINLAMPPMIDSAEDTGVYLKPSMLFSVASTSKNKDAAVDFINYFTNDVEANKVLAGERGVPISSKIREALKPDLDEINQKVYDYIDLVGKHASPIDPPPPAGDAEITNTLKELFKSVVYGQKTSADAAAEFMKTANEILAR